MRSLLKVPTYAEAHTPRTLYIDSYSCMRADCRHSD